MISHRHWQLQSKVHTREEGLVAHIEKIIIEEAVVSEASCCGRGQVRFKFLNSLRARAR